MASQLSTSRKAPSRRRWWRPQFRLRSLLALMLAACGAMGWWRWHMHSYQEQRLAAAAISNKAVFVGMKPGRPAWLQRLSDPDVFRDVTHLSFHGRRNVTDADLAHLAKFPKLNRLSLDSTAITDEGLAHLSGLTNLDTLSLKNTKVTSAGLAKLRGLMNLKKLQLSNTKIDGPGLAHVAGMKKLEVLELDGLAIEDEHLVDVEGLTALTNLNLGETRLRGPGLARLKQLPSLNVLHASGTWLEQVELTGFPRLKELMCGAGPKHVTRYKIVPC